MAMKPGQWQGTEVAVENPLDSRIHVTMLKRMACPTLCNIQTAVVGRELGYTPCFNEVAALFAETECVSGYL